METGADLNNHMAQADHQEIEMLRARITAALPGFNLTDLRLNGGRWYAVDGNGVPWEVSALLKAEGGGKVGPA